jgi:hypothetical protein
MGRRRIHTQGGAIDMSVLGQPQTTPMSMLSHPALMSNVGIHNVLQGIHSPLHPNTLRSTGGDLKRDLKHLAYHHLQSGKRGHDLMDDIYHSGRQLLGVGLYAQPHGGDLLDSIYNTGRQLLDSGIDGKPLVDMLLHHSGRGVFDDARQGGQKLFTPKGGKDFVSQVEKGTADFFQGKGVFAEPSGGNVMRGLDKFGEVLLNKVGDKAIDATIGHFLGHGIPAPPSRSPITDPSLIGGKMRRMKGGNELTGGDISAHNKAKIQQALAPINAINKGLSAVGKVISGPDFDKNVADIGHAFGRGVKPPRKGRFVKGSAEAKAYMASIRKKGKNKGGAVDIGNIAETALKFAPLLALL